MDENSDNLIRFDCPGCGADIEIPPELLGHKLRCDICKTKFVMEDDPGTGVPENDAVVSPAPAPVQPPDKVEQHLRTHEHSLCSAKNSVLQPQSQVTSSPARGTLMRSFKKPVILISAAFVIIAAAGGLYRIMGQGAEAVVSPDSFKAPVKKYGIEIVEWKKPPAIPTDDQLKILDSEGAAGFRNSLAELLESHVSGEGADSKDGLQEALQDKDCRLALRRYEILRGAGAGVVDEIRKKPQGVEFLHFFMSNMDWMDDMLASGPFGSYAEVLRNLAVLFKYDKEITIPLYRRLATAVALERRGNKYNLVAMFQGYKNAHKDGLLHSSFDELETRAMRFTIIHWGPQELKSLLYDRNYQSGRYRGACWSCAYKGHNRYGDSIQTPHYYQPWHHVYDNAERGRREGGVCGTLSTYGAMAARAHGIPSTAAGEPGHCAYVVRDLNKTWRRAYHVANPTRPKKRFWSSSVPFLQLMEKIYADRDKVIKAREYVWLAEFIADRSKISFDAPLHYKAYSGTWRNLPDFTTLTPVKEGTSKGFAYKPLVAGIGNFGISFAGSFTLKTKTDIHFRISSDDGSRLLIDGKLIINNDGQHSNTAKTADLSLEPGTHSILVDYFDSGGGNALEVVLQAPMPSGVYAAAELAAETLPSHYGIQQYRINLLASKNDVSPKEWRQAADVICKGFSQDHDAAWRLLNDKPLRALAELSPSEKMRTILRWHQSLNLKHAQNADSADFIRFLNQQADRIGDSQTQLRFASQLMDIYKESSGYSASVFSWGNSRFGSKPKTAAAFSRVIADFLKKSGEDVPGGAAGRLAESILAVESSENIEAFQRLSDLASNDEILKTDPHGIRRFNKKQASNFPAAEPFTGDLLSKDGLLRISSNGNTLSVLSHRSALMDEPLGGIFITNREKKPWAEVVLAGPAQLSGIVLINRYETGKDHQVPLTVSVSADGKKWKDVYKSDEVQSVWRIPLEGIKEAARVRYIKASVDHGDKNEYFHMRGFRVYGKKLY